MATRKTYNKSKYLKKPKAFNVLRVEAESNLSPIQIDTPLSKSPAELTLDQKQASIGHVAQLSRCVSNSEKPKFSSQNGDFEIWKIRLDAHLTKLGLDDVINNPNPCPSKNKMVYLELVTLLDNESLQLIATTDTKNDGKRAFEKLTDYYLGNVNARTVKAILELNSLKMNPSENVKQFIARCDLLRTNLIALNLNEGYEKTLVLNTNSALPEKFEIFKTLITTSSVLASWENFKLQLMNYDCVNNNKPKVNSVMNVENYHQRPKIVHQRRNQQYKKILNKQIICFKCNAINDHMTQNCGRIMRNNHQHFKRNPKMQQPTKGLHNRGNTKQNWNTGNRPWHSHPNSSRPGHQNNFNNYGQQYKGKYNQRA